MKVRDTGSGAGNGGPRLDPTMVPPVPPPPGASATAGC